MVEERGLIDPKRLREQPWKTGRDPRLQGARLQEDYPRCCHLCFCCTTAGHHADLIGCPRCSSFISGCTGMGGRVHCQVLGALLHVPGCGESRVKLFGFCSGKHAPTSQYHTQWRIPPDVRTDGFWQAKECIMPSQISYCSHFVVNHSIRKVNVGLLK